MIKNLITQSNQTLYDYTHDGCGIHMELSNLTIVIVMLFMMMW